MATKFYDLNSEIRKAASAGERTINLPCGTFKVAVPARVPAGAVVRVIGHGRGTVLEPAASFPGGPLLSLEGAGQNCELASFRIVNLDIENVESGIRLARPVVISGSVPSSGIHTLRNVWSVGKFKVACIDNDGSELCTFDKVVAESLNAMPSLLLRNSAGGLQTFCDVASAYTNQAGGPTIKIHASHGTVISDIHFGHSCLNGGGIEIIHESGQCELLSFDGVRAECGALSDYVFRVTVAAGLALGPISVARCMLESRVSNWKSLGIVSQLTWGGNKCVNPADQPTIDAERLDWSDLKLGTAWATRIGTAIGTRATVNANGKADGVPADKVTRVQP